MSGWDSRSTSAPAATSASRLHCVVGLRRELRQNVSRVGPMVAGLDIDKVHRASEAMYGTEDVMSYELE